MTTVQQTSHIPLSFAQKKHRWAADQPACTSQICQVSFDPPALLAAWPAGASRAAPRTGACLWPAYALLLTLRSEWLALPHSACDFRRGRGKFRTARCAGRGCGQATKFSWYPQVLLIVTSLLVIQSTYARILRGTANFTSNSDSCCVLFF